AFKLTSQDQSRTGPALVAVVRATAVPVVEAEPVLAAAQWAGSVLVDQEPRLDPEQGKDFAPMVPGALDRVAGHAVPFAWARAQAIARDRSQERVDCSGGIGSTSRRDGQSPNFSLYL